MVLPDEIKLLDPLSTDLRILNLIPFDGDDTWDRETTRKLEEYFSSKKNLGDYRICRVEMAVKNTIFTETFEIRQRNDDIRVDIVKYALKNELLKKDMCSKNEAVSGKLKSLICRAGLYIPKPIAPAVVKAAKSKSKQDDNTALIKRKQLLVGSDYQVHIKHFDHPDYFWIRLDNKNNKVLQGMLKKIEECDSRIPVQELKEGKVCLVVVGERTAHRGMITEIHENETCSVFLVDVGEFMECNNKNIFEIPETLVGILAFQAVQCRLMGVKPRFELREWLPRPSQAFQEFIKEVANGRSLKMRVLAENLHIHDVMLFHPDNNQRLDKLAAKDKYADAADVDVVIENREDLNVESVLGFEIEEESKENVNIQAIMDLINKPDADINLEVNDCLQHMGYPETARILPPEIPKQKKIKKISSRKASTLKMSQSDDQKLRELKVVPNTLPSTLSYIHKHPRVEWQQNEFAIILHFSAVNCIDYGVRINGESLEISIKHQSHYERAMIYLYGAIEAYGCSHEKTGNRIIVRLLKSIYMDWPRLTDADEPNRFITFNSNSLPADLFANPTEVQKSRPAGRPAGDSDIDENFENAEVDDDVLEI